ncbi:hypothetical protein A2Z33_05690 [Candidatus Gottesmanbacteria bacterium RBG_16_52_11]|uniref:Alpha/beta hydrolase n=1 Tax=Candidatus Gottesmanbacteria bacterium RBG_16_52_11 TaxID=1798374 RepID=A0A1F5YXB8_9BACT|nr:MAG: hypothetical protein A2Z33_05690 [Candidatus Gottesmanbacteria bacterium RBG_16_52_11]
MYVLILHGVMGRAGIYWQQTLHDQLVRKGYPVIMPTLPDADHPDRSEWLRTVQELVRNIDPGQLVIVGHSLGVVAALDFLEKSASPVQALISVSGFSDNYGDEINDFYMKVKSVDFTRVRNHVRSCSVIYGGDDPYVPQPSLRKLAEDLQVTPVVIPRGGHFDSESGTGLVSLLLDRIAGLNSESAETGPDKINL